MTKKKPLPSNIDEGSVYLIGTFNDEESEHIAHDAISALLVAHSKLPIDEPITLFISSSGGFVELGLAIQSIIEHIRRSGRTVIAHVIGHAFSSAFDIVQHCDIRRAEPIVALMIHEEQLSDDGPASSGKRLNEDRFSKKMERAQFEILAQRTGHSVKYYMDKTHTKDWYLTAQEALDAGLLDEIVQPRPFPFTPGKDSKPVQARKAKRDRQSDV